MSMVIAAVITKAALAGSGCKAANKVEAHFNADYSELLVAIPEFSTTRRANCDVVMTIDHAPNLQMRPVSAKISWNGQLAADASALLTFKYHYQAQVQTPSGSVNFSAGGGPVGRRDDVVAVEKPLNSPCGASTTLVLSVAAMVRGTGRADIAAVGPFNVEWSSCSASKG